MTINKLKRLIEFLHTEACTNYNTALSELGKNPDVSSVGEKEYYEGSRNELKIVLELLNDKPEAIEDIKSRIDYSNGKRWNPDGTTYWLPKTKIVK